MTEKDEHPLEQSKAKRRNYEYCMKPYQLRADSDSIPPKMETEPMRGWEDSPKWEQAECNRKIEDG
jgi:hypothetical protein